MSRLIRKCQTASGGPLYMQSEISQSDIDIINKINEIKNYLSNGKLRKDAKQLYSTFSHGKGLYKYGKALYKLIKTGSSAVSPWKALFSISPTGTFIDNILGDDIFTIPTSDSKEKLRRFRIASGSGGYLDDLGRVVIPGVTQTPID